MFAGFIIGALPGGAIGTIAGAYAGAKALAPEGEGHEAGIGAVVGAIGNTIGAGALGTAAGAAREACGLRPLVHPKHGFLWDDSVSPSVAIQRRLHEVIPLEPARLPRAARRPGRVSPVEPTSRLGA